MTENDPTRDVRRETEEAARTGRFPDEDGGLRDDSTPVERDAPPDEVDDDDTMRQNGYLRSPSQGARPDR